MKKLVLIIVMLVGGLGIFLTVILFRGLNEKQIQVQVAYNTIDIKGKRIGILQADRVVIQDMKGKELSAAEYEVFDIYPQQIVLGEDGYYLFQLETEPWETKENVATIAKFDYQSNLKAKISVSNIVMIACREGKLFLAEWIADASGNEPDAGIFLGGFYANSYIDEKDFGSKSIKEIPEDNSEIIFGNTVLFRHKEGFFATEPEIGGYVGFGWYDCDSGNVEETKSELKWERERKSFTQLYSNIASLASRSSRTFEYQSGEMLYGASNELKKGQRVVPASIFSQSVNMAYFYKIDSGSNTFKLLHEIENGYGILTTENYVIFQKENKLYKTEIKTGTSQMLLDLNNDREHKILYQIKGDFLRVLGDEDHYFYWDQDNVREIRVD